MINRLRHGLVPAFLLLCLLLGGASAAGYWSNLGLQLGGILMIFLAVAARRSAPLATPARQAIALLLLGVGLFALQLIPLPPAVWSHLPGREAVTNGFAMLRLPLPWAPISMEPYKTLDSALWLLPAAGVFLGILLLGGYRASWIAWVLVAVSIVSVAIGAVQLAGGESSGAYLYRITNVGAMTGFFANANHLATLLLATIPFLAALYLSAIEKGRSVKKSSGLAVILLGTAAVIVVGLIGATSIAGFGLAVPVAGASVLLVYARKRRVPKWVPPLLALLLVGSVAVVFSAPFNNNLTGQRAHTSQDSRLTSFTLTAKAASAFFPTGSGVGTFQQVYRTLEDQTAVDRFYMNHTHGDYLELALETGIPGLAIVALFILWWLRRTLSLWREEGADPFAKAATIAIGAMLAHSIVDYPLRTAAMSAVFAACCALLASPRPSVRRKSGSESDKARARHLSAD